MKIRELILRRRQIGLASLVWIVIASAVMLAFFRVDFWEGWTILGVVAGLWIGRRVGASIASDRLWGRLIGGVVGAAVAFPASFFAQLMRLPTRTRAVVWGDLPIAIVGGAYFGLLIGVGAEVVVRWIRDRRFHRIRKLRRELGNIATAV